MDPILFRAMERILAVVIGGISVYLGYRLFLLLPQRTDSQGKVILPGNISIYLSRVGPGVFFALFGAAVVSLSLYQAVTYSSAAVSGKEREGGVAAARREGGGVYYSGVGNPEGAGDAPDREVARAALRRDMAILNNLRTLLRPNLEEGRRVDLELAIPRIKRTLMRTAWGNDWGDYTEFIRWTEEGAKDPPPPSIRNAASLYRQGLPEGTP